jgi:prepilin-type N-terminal cleavage/methylation domain-containing protein
MNNIFKKEKGFTLLEMLISIMIISIGVLGTYSVVFRYTKNTQLERENLIASYLCQEGIEIVKNMRDTNWLTTGNSWNAGLTSCASGCEIDYNGKGGDGSTSGLTVWSSGNYLWIDAMTGLYKYEYVSGTDTETTWKRKITIDSSTTDILNITVTVYWGSVATAMTVKEDIYNWK